MAKEAKKDVAVAEDTDLMIFGENNGELINYQEDAGLGNENVGQDDLATPRIILLQDLSKVVKSGNIAGAAPGMFYNSVTDELFTEKYVIPLDYQKEWAVFKKRKQGGGYFGSFNSEQAAKDHTETLDGVPDMYDVIESARQVLVTLHGSGERKGQINSPVVMHFASTALSSSNSFNSAIQMTLGSNVPRFAGVWKMTVEQKSNGNNEQWYGPNFTFAGKCAANLYNEVRELYYSITNKVDPKKINPETGEIAA